MDKRQYLTHKDKLMSKAYYKSLPSVNGFTWGGYWDGLHRFVKGDLNGTHYLCSVAEQDIFDRSYLLMLERGLTRNEWADCPNHDVIQGMFEWYQRLEGSKDKPPNCCQE